MMGDSDRTLLSPLFETVFLRRYFGSVCIDITLPKVYEHWSLEKVPEKKISVVRAGSVAYSITLFKIHKLRQPIKAQKKNPFISTFV